MFVEWNYLNFNIIFLYHLQMYFFCCYSVFQLLILGLNHSQVENYDD